MTNQIILNALLLNENMDSTMEPCRFRDEWPRDLYTSSWMWEYSWGLRPGFHMYGLCPYTYTDPDPVCIRFNYSPLLSIDPFPYLRIVCTYVCGVRFDCYLERFNHICAPYLGGMLIKMAFLCVYGNSTYVRIRIRIRIRTYVSKTYKWKKSLMMWEYTLGWMWEYG